MDIGFFAIAAVAVTFAGISKAGFGSGAAFASATILALVMPPAQALGLMLPLLMLIDIATLKPFWKKWAWPESKVLILGAIPGVALGSLLFTVANDDVLRFLIGAVAVGFVIWHRWPRRTSLKPMPMRYGYLTGVVAGFTSFISHAGGPPAAVFLLSRQLSKTQYQASTVIIFWAINIAKFVPYAFLGVFTIETFKLGFVLGPFALVGAWIGVRLHYKIEDRIFFAITYVLLTVTGGKLIFDALT